MHRMLVPLRTLAANFADAVTSKGLPHECILRPLASRIIINFASRASLPRATPRMHPAAA